MNIEELKWIKQAIINEIEGYEFYQMAAKQAEDESTRSAFIKLAQEEMKHVEWLKELFSSKQAGNDTFDLAMVEAPPSPHLFKWDNLDRKHAGISMSVFSIGMQMEEASVEFYTKVSSEAKSPEVKELFKVLIQWEKNHYELFYKEYESMKEGWWADQGFSPF